MTISSPAIIFNKTSNFRVAITEMYPRIPWKLVAEDRWRSTQHTSGVPLSNSISLHVFIYIELEDQGTILRNVGNRLSSDSASYTFLGHTLCNSRLDPCVWVSGWWGGERPLLPTLRVLSLRNTMSGYYLQGISTKMQ
jgi:hypothetical protein